MKHFQQEREAAARPTGQRVHGHEPPAGVMEHRRPRARRSGFGRLFDMLDSNFWLLAGLTLGIAVLIMGWWLVSGKGADGMRLFDQSRRAAEQTQKQPDAPTTQTVEQLEDHLAGLIDRVNMLTDSINYLESKLIRAHVLTDSIISAEQRTSSAAPKQVPADASVHRTAELRPTAAGQATDNPEPAQTLRESPAGPAAASRQSTENIASHATPTDAHRASTRRVSSAASAEAVSSSDTVAKSPINTENNTAGKSIMAATAAAPPAAKQLPAASAPQGQWVVNLASSPSEADAERFAAMARSKGIETQQQRVTVKGSDYWRVQTLGFPTAAEAQDYAGTVREKLGLQNVWVTRR